MRFVNNDYFYHVLNDSYSLTFRGLGYLDYLCHYCWRKFRKEIYKMKKQLVLASIACLWAAQALALDLDTDKKRFSYIVGLQIGQQFKNDKIELDEVD